MYIESHFQKPKKLFHNQHSGELQGLVAGDLYELFQGVVSRFLLLNAKAIMCISSRFIMSQCWKKTVLNHSLSIVEYFLHACMEGVVIFAGKALKLKFFFNISVPFLASLLNSSCY